MTETRTPGPYEAVADVAFDDIPASGWAVFPAGDKAIAILLGPNAAANAAFFANAPCLELALKAIAETPLEGEDCDGQPQHWFDDYRKRFEEIVCEARNALRPTFEQLDFCGLDCPHCGGDDTLGAVGSRPMKAGQTAAVRCTSCGFCEAHVLRDTDDGLYVVSGQPAGSAN